MLLIGLLCSLSLLIVTNKYIKADTISGTNFDLISDLSLYDIATGEYYEFENIETRDAFLDQYNLSEVRQYTPYEKRTLISRQYTTIGSNSHTAHTVYGGRYGGPVSRNTSISVGIEELRCILSCSCISICKYCSKS